LNPAWLLLTDADVLHGPETVANLGLIASHGPYDLVSFMVKLHLRKSCRKTAHCRLPVFLFHALPASLDSRYPALDRRSGRGLHARESRNSGTRRRAGIHSRCRYRRLLAGPASEATGREIMDRTNRPEPKFATIRVLLGLRAHGLAHGLQPIETLLAAATVRRCGHGDHLSGTSTVVAHTQQADDLYGRWGHLRAKYCRIET
jgi:hypothetical protein